jgi:hypothetical protein
MRRKLVGACLLLVFITIAINFHNVNATITGNIGDALEDSRMIFYVVNCTEITGSIGLWTPEQGNKYFIVEIVVKNKLTQPLSFSILFLKLNDAQGYEYSSSIATSGLDYGLSGGKIAPKDIVRGQVAFEIPSNTTGSSLKYNDFSSIFIVELTPSLNPEPIPISEYTPQFGVGDTVQDNRVALTLNSYEKSPSISIYQAKQGWTFLIIDITIKNVGQDNINYNVLYINVKDSQGHVFGSHIATSSLPGGLSSGTLTPTENVRGKVAFQVPENETYFVIHYDDFYSFFAAPVIPEFTQASIILLMTTILIIIALLAKANRLCAREKT